MKDKTKVRLWSRERRLVVGRMGLMVGSPFGKGSSEGPSEKLGELRPECRCRDCMEIWDSCRSRGNDKSTDSEVKTGRFVGPDTAEQDTGSRAKQWDQLFLQVVRHQ